jgi:hypothetical protein
VKAATYTTSGHSAFILAAPGHQEAGIQALVQRLREYAGHSAMFSPRTLRTRVLSQNFVVAIRNSIQIDAIDGHFCREHDAQGGLVSEVDVNKSKLPLVICLDVFDSLSLDATVAFSLEWHGRTLQPRTVLQVLQAPKIKLQLSAFQDMQEAAAGER